MVKLEATLEAFALKVTGLPVRPVTVAVTVLIPGVAPVVHDPRVAIPAVLVTGVAPVSVPPPAVTAKVTVTPPTPKLFASVTFTEGLVATAWLVSADWDVAEVAAILVGGPTLVPPSSVELLQLATAAAANARSAA